MENEEERELVEHFSGACHLCGKHVDGRKHNATWNPVNGVAHVTCHQQEH
jgi:hypothetical protein